LPIIAGLKKFRAMTCWFDFSITQLMKRRCRINDDGAAKKVDDGAAGNGDYKVLTPLRRRPEASLSGFAADFN